MEQALGKAMVASAVTGIRIASDGLNADIHASAEYRAEMVSVMAGRAVERLLNEPMSW
jgi:carbon-monoxide dehydrogenase medium subunit